MKGVRIGTDWSSAPPAEVWRRKVGPGWSSFAVRRDLVYTQEQRGGDEIVSCYRLSNGQPVWRHRDKARFWESNAGAGPRGTPTVHNGRVYTFGATGIVNALDADTGALIWTRNAGKDTGAPTPYWGFSSSPIVVNDMVVVAAGSRMIAYDTTTGEKRWSGGPNGASYSSPHLMTIDGVPQIVLLAGNGAVSVDPATGKKVWQHEWSMGGATIVQPQLLPDGDVLISATTAMAAGSTRRLRVSREGSKWSVQERWTSIWLKPYFNDFVVHNGHAYGFDGNILACIDLNDGARKWKGGRYGAGQLVLLAEQDLLLVVSEEGELALVSATPDKYTEVAKAPAIEGKTWNHPIVVRDLVLVRNDQEMAAFRLPAATLAANR